MQFPDKFDSEKIRILILGSYYPKHFRVLTELKESLITKGFKNTFISADLVKIQEKIPSKEKSADILLKIRKYMFKSDFNIFVFFSEGKNESTIVELMSLVESNYFKGKEAKILLFLPKNYSSLMLEGLITIKKLIFFSYDNELDIYQKSFAYLKQNIINIID